MTASTTERKSSSAKLSAPRVVLAHNGNAPFVQQAARALHEAGMLQAYATSFAYRPHRASGRLLRLAFRAFSSAPDVELSRRRITEVPDELVRTRPAREMARTISKKLRINPIYGDFINHHAERDFSRVVGARLLNDADAIFSYENVALEAFREAKARGLKRLHFSPIAHHATMSRLLEPEFEEFPETQTPFSRHAQRMAPRQNAIKDEEIALADVLLAPSSFVRDSLLSANVPPDKIRLVPFGAPPVAPAPSRDERERKKREPFVFLSAGSQSVRKGTHYLLQAWKQLNPGPNAQLWLVGAMTLPARVLENLPDNVIVRPPVLRQELFALYEQASVMAFPSLCEGFAQVVPEAMAHGLPVLTTLNSGAGDLISSGENGWLVPIRDVDTLAQQMDWCLTRRSDCEQIGERARQTAERWQWADYRALLADTVRHDLQPSWPAPAPFVRPDLSRAETQR